MPTKLRLAQKFIKTAYPVVRNAAIGGIAGAAAGYSVSDAHGSEAGSKRGKYVGAAIGAATGLPFGKLAKGLQHGTRVFTAGLKAQNPASKTAKVLHAADRGYTRGRYMFRRVRGRIIPILSK